MAVLLVRRVRQAIAGDLGRATPRGRSLRSELRDELEVVVVAEFAVATGGAHARDVAGEDLDLVRASPRVQDHVAGSILGLLEEDLAFRVVAVERAEDGARISRRRSADGRV